MARTVCQLTQITLKVPISHSITNPQAKTIIRAHKKRGKESPRKWARRRADCRWAVSKRLMKPNHLSWILKSPIIWSEQGTRLRRMTPRINSQARAFQVRSLASKIKMKVKALLSHLVLARRVHQNQPNLSMLPRLLLGRTTWLWRRLQAIVLYCKALLPSHWSKALWKWAVLSKITQMMKTKTSVTNNFQSLWVWVNTSQKQTRIFSRQMSNSRSNYPQATSSSSLWRLRMRRTLSYSRCSTKRWKRCNK